jgi:hypothetical protein
MKTPLVALVAALVVALPLVAAAEDKPVTNVKQLAGEWQGWVTQGSGSERATMTIKEDGSYTAATRGGTRTVGNFYLENGKLRYKSSRSSGGVKYSEDKGKARLTIVPESTTYETGVTDYERVK